MNEIIHGDCLEIMPALPDAAFDLIFCDLPYGTTRSPWDSIIPVEPLWKQYERLIKQNGAILLFAKAPFDKVLYASQPELFRYEWIWEKNKATGHLNAEHMPMQAHENILVFYKETPTYNPQMESGHKPMNFARRKNTASVYGNVEGCSNAGATERHPRSVLYFPVVNNDDPERIHPNQKPVELCEYLIKTYTNEGETVLDNCSGSASIAAACMNTNRNFIAVEKELEYVVKSRNRLSSLQMCMF